MSLPRSGRLLAVYWQLFTYPWSCRAASTIQLSGKTLHAPNTPHAKLVKNLNVSHRIFEQLLYQNEPRLL